MFQRTNAPFPSEREMGVTRKSRALMAVKTAAVQPDWSRMIIPTESTASVSSVTVWGRETPRCYFECMLVVLQL